MFVVCDENDNVIAFHDYLDVVEEYINNVKRTHPDAELHIGKIKRKRLERMHIDSLYLVRYAETYVQEGYVEYLAIVSDQYIYDYKYARDVLLKILEDGFINKSERNILKKATKIVDNILYDSEVYTPDLEELKNLKLDYDPYLYNFGSYNKFL